MAEAALKQHSWPRFLDAPDGQLVEELYQPGLERAVRYDRCCAYFSSSALSAAAAGFGAFIQNILAGAIAQKPALRLLVNEELQAADVEALLSASERAPLIEQLLSRFGSPASALQKKRLEMLAWLAREGWLEIRVGVMRSGQGILHAKFGIFEDAQGDAVVFAGSGNESASGLTLNFENLEISTSWDDPERYTRKRSDFDTLWKDKHSAVAVFNLPEAVKDELIKFAPPEPPVTDAVNQIQRRKAVMLWEYVLSSPWFEDGGAATCDAMAPVSLWPHQRKVVTETASAFPDGRLLCDEVGMGKTIEAILVLRRLLAGRGVRRALLLLPANLLQQWQSELREKGGLSVPRLEGGKTLIWPDGTRRNVESLGQALEQDLLLMSRETARMDANVTVLLEAQPWDIVLLDEGHAARRASQVEGEFNTPTLLLGLLRELQRSGQAKSLMILSATPMQTHPWEPWDLIQVLGEGGLWLSGFHVVRTYFEAREDLRRGRLSTPEARALARILDNTAAAPESPSCLSLEGLHAPESTASTLRLLPAANREVAAQWLLDVSPLHRRMHRNTRRTLRRYYEMGLLDRPPPTREVREVSFAFETDEERDVYDAVEEYIDRRFRQLEQEKPGKGFVMTIYRRRAASSPYALSQSLARRAQGLKAVMAQRAFDPSELGFEDAEELEELLNTKLTSALPEDAAAAKAELHEVEKLLGRIDALGGLDTKRDRLVDLTKELTADGRGVLVFTSYSDTMEYLRDKLLGAYGATVASYSGQGGARWRGSAWEQVTKEEVTAALRGGEIRVLVCTDAASEGLNLQAAGALINFDLPWNPSRVEQRIGRVDRIGQKSSVLPIRNLFLEGSIDERVYRALSERCRLFEGFIGPMQPVLSKALRMLVGREPVNRKALEEASKKIEQDPVISVSFAEDEPLPLDGEKPLFSKNDTASLVQALDGSGTTVEPLGNVGYLIDGRLKLCATDVGSEANEQVVDGLSDDQWQLLQAMKQPGERLPLLVVASAAGSYRQCAAVWISGATEIPVKDFEHAKQLVDGWDGKSVDSAVWLAAQARLAAELGEKVEASSKREGEELTARKNAQIAAAKFRLMDAVGKLVLVSGRGAGDLNEGFYSLMAEQTATAERLRKAFNRLGDYPTWDSIHVEELSGLISNLSAADAKALRAGAELDAALADPRWQFREAAGTS
jgi:superfamily II DNA or RNA helicase